MEANVRKIKLNTGKSRDQEKARLDSRIRVQCSLVVNTRDALRGTKDIRSLRSKDQYEILAKNTGWDQKYRVHEEWARTRFEISYSWLEEFAKILRRNWNLNKNTCNV